jgi:hypothetical protein
MKIIRPSSPLELLLEWESIILIQLQEYSRVEKGFPILLYKQLPTSRRSITRTEGLL